MVGKAEPRSLRHARTREDAAATCRDGLPDSARPRLSATLYVLNISPQRVMGSTAQRVMGNAAGMAPLRARVPCSKVPMPR